MQQGDPYAQNKAETIAKTMSEGEVKVTGAVPFKGGLYAIIETVRLLQHQCGFPPSEYQVKFSASINALRLSDYHSRAVAEPGQFFWLFNGVIMSGDREEHQQCFRIADWVRGESAEPGETELTAQLYAIVASLKTLRAGG